MRSSPEWKARTGMTLRAISYLGASIPFCQLATEAGRPRDTWAPDDPIPPVSTAPNKASCPFKASWHEKTDPKPLVSTITQEAQTTLPFCQSEDIKP